MLGFPPTFFFFGGGVRIREMEAYKNLSESGTIYFLIIF